MPARGFSSCSWFSKFYSYRALGSERHPMVSLSLTHFFFSLNKLLCQVDSFYAFVSSRGLTFSPDDHQASRLANGYPCQVRRHEVICRAVSRLYVYVLSLTTLCPSPCIPPIRFSLYAPGPVCPDLSVSLTFGFLSVFFPVHVQILLLRRSPIIFIFRFLRNFAKVIVARTMPHRNHLAPVVPPAVVRRGG